MDLERIHAGIRKATLEQPVHPTTEDQLPGIRLREWLIGQAVAGLCTCRHQARDSTPQAIAADAVAIADAVIDRLCPPTAAEEAEPSVRKSRALAEQYVDSLDD